MCGFGTGACGRLVHFSYRVKVIFQMLDRTIISDQFSFCFSNVPNQAFMIRGLLFFSYGREIQVHNVNICSELSHLSYITCPMRLKKLGTSVIPYFTSSGDNTFFKSLIISEILLDYIGKIIQLPQIFYLILRSLLHVFFNINQCSAPEWCQCDPITKPN